ncbi:helix-turn-helix transcriptional regulator [Longispora sp. K20-0274]|uniref:helix-turn-helix domain-containing protein n=1 Tax=Longispora sp. K20-0274 TaxID=3088255 RepID=UPI003999A443
MIDDARGLDIARARKARRWTQQQLADAAAISLSLLTKIEQGKRPATPEALEAISRALGLPPTASTSRVHEAIPAIRAAVAACDLPEDGPTRSLAALRSEVERATALRLGTRYSELAVLLPSLMAELSRAVALGRGAPRMAASALFAMACRSADAVAFKHGYLDLAAHLVDVVRSASVESGDATLAAMAAYLRAETFLANRQLDAGARMLDQAMTEARPGHSTEAMATYGTLHMRAAVLAARAGRPDTARDHLTEAARVARRVPEGVYHGTAFGPANVRVHEVAMAVELGDVATALKLSDRWTVPVVLPAERRSHHHIDLARAFVWAGRREQALRSLVAARRIAPQHTRESPLVRRTVAELIDQHRTPPEALLAFASWAGATSA